MAAARKGNGPGHGGPANGAGWGGPAKGASTSRIRPGDPDGIQRMSHDPAKKAARAAHTEELKAVLYGIATNPAEPAMVRIQAADKLLNRIEGLPIARTVAVNGTADLSSLSDEALAAIVAEGEETAQH